MEVPFLAEKLPMAVTTLEQRIRVVEACQDIYSRCDFDKTVTGEMLVKIENCIDIL